TGTRVNTEIYSRWLNYIGANTTEYNAGLDSDSRKEIEQGLMENHERGGQLLAPGAHRPEQPRAEGHPYRLHGQPQRVHRGDLGRVPQDPGTEVHRAPDPQFPEICGLQG